MKILALWWVCVSVLWVLPLKTPLNEQTSQEPKTHSISTEDESLGVGQSLNVTHNASRIDQDISLTWQNGSSNCLNISIGENWQVDSLAANITDLTDTRNWVNGTFNYGLSDGNNATDDNDSGWHGLDWTFGFLEFPYKDWQGSDPQYPYQYWYKVIIICPGIITIQVLKLGEIALNFG